MPSPSRSETPVEVVRIPLEEAPQPCPVLEDYTPDRVVKGKRYADDLLESKRLSRKVSPVTQKILQLYSAACADFTESPGSISDGEQTEARKEIQRWEEIIKGHMSFKPVENEEQGKRLADVMRLRRFDYYARYGDYAARLITELRTIAGQTKADNWETISSKYSWQNISEMLEEQQSIWKELSALLDVEDIGTAQREELKLRAPTHFVIWETCNINGLDYKQIIAGIKMYASRCGYMHSGIERFLDKNDAAGLANQLRSDLTDIPKVFQLDASADQIVFETIIKDMINNWFDGFDEFEDASLWVALPSLSAEILKRRHLDREDRADKDASGTGSRPTSKSKADAELVERAAGKSVLRLRKNNEAKWLIKLLCDGLPGPTLPDPNALGILPRSASGTVAELGPEMRKRRRTMYDDLIKVYAGLSNMFNKSLKDRVQELRAANGMQRQFHSRFGPSIDPPSSSETSPTKSKSLPKVRRLRPKKGSFSAETLETALENLRMSTRIPSPPILPSGWIALWNSDTEAYLYWNESTKSMTSVLPDEST